MRTFVVAVLILVPTLLAMLITAPLAAAAVPPGRLDSSESANSSPQIWAACGRSSPETKVVRIFPMKHPVGGPQLAATLFCGNDRFGYRHIANGHGQDWQNIAFYTGENWRSSTDFAIEQILTVPEPGYPKYRKDNDTWNYRAPLEIRDSEGVVRATYRPIVTVAARDGKIITAFPSR